MTMQYLSADDGVNWEEVTNCQLHAFQHVGNRLKWRAVLLTTDDTKRPSISSITIDYIPPQVPTISSSTHPENTWVNNTTVEFNWTAVGGPSDVTYYCKLDGHDDYFPTTETSKSYKFSPRQAD